LPCLAGANDVFQHPDKLKDDRDEMWLFSGKKLGKKESPKLLKCQ
jgi:hypothetical protein